MIDEGTPVVGRAFRIAWILFAFGTVTATAISFLRVGFNLSVSQPLQVFTSGFEDESLFAIWKWVHGQPVFWNPERIPFAGSYFNWLFYSFYGAITKLILLAGHLPDDWITQIGKWITLAGTVMLGFAVRRALVAGTRNDAFPDQFRNQWIFVVAFFSMVSPLIGFWSITTRPDVWALALEVLAVGSYLHFVNSGRHREIILFLLFGYFAWGFKQVHITAVAACLVDCAVRGRWRLAFLLATILSVAFGVTLLAGGEVYRFMVLKSQVRSGFHLHIGVENLVTALLKSPLTWMPWLAGLYIIARSRAGGALPAFPASERVLNLAALISLFFFVPLACKVGAADNYFLAFSTFALLAWAARLINYRHRAQAVAVIIASLFLVAGCAAVLLGKRGRLDCSETHGQLMSIKACLADLPKPTLAWGNQASLPWINPNDENHFVLGAAYYSIPIERLERGGIDGLIASNYFAAVVDLSATHGDICGKYLQRMERHDCPGVVYVRRDL